MTAEEPPQWAERSWLQERLFVVVCNQNESCSTHSYTQTAGAKDSVYLYPNHTDAGFAAKEIILNLQQGYQIAHRNKKMSLEDDN